MHSAVETVSLDDLDHAADLLARPEARKVLLTLTDGEPILFYQALSACGPGGLDEAIDLPAVGFREL